jgi:uncharacterized membrane protein
MSLNFSFQKIVAAFFVFAGIMIAARVIYSGEYKFLFLVWNLFLAWIPFLVSTQFKKMQQKPLGKQAAIFLLWFIFFPNALYIVTDLIHLDSKTNIPRWYDVVLLFTSSMLGLLMAFVSLIRLERFLLQKYRHRVVDVLMFFILFFGSFGVYLGRFLRWNSWDIVSNPFNLLHAVAVRFIFPLQHLRTWGITVMLTILFYLLYLTIKKLPGYMNQAIV